MLLAAPPPPSPALAPRAPRAVEFLTEAESLALFFPQADSLERKLVIPPAELELVLRRGALPRHYFRYEARLEGQLLGFAVVDEVMGKARPITYMLATSAAGEVLGIEVLAYRESHGGEIDREAFRDQFKGRQADDALRLGGDIRNIAGATISCRAITDGVADMLDLLRATPVAVAASPPATEEGPSEEAAGLARVRVLMNAPLAIRLAPSDELGRAELLAATEAAFAEVARLEDILSAYRSDSDPSRLTKGAGGDWIEVQPETLALFQRAMQVSLQSGGRVTPLAGALTKLLEEAPAASQAALSAAAKLCAARLAETQPASGEAPARMRLLRRGMRLDFGASGKGLALERAAAGLEAAGLPGGLLDFGGQFLCFGAHEETVELPGGRAVTLARGSLATSGDLERGGQRSHLVDARSGAPVPVHGAVTVFAASALDADLWSSALYVLGPEPGLELAGRLGLAARFEAWGEQPGAPLASPAWTARFGEER